MSRLQIEFYGDPCRSCNYSWTLSREQLVTLIRNLPQRYDAILEGMTGDATAPELTWNASSYVLHVADNLRLHAERMVGAARGSTATFLPVDQDEIADARHYERVTLEGALWSLSVTVGPYLEVFDLADRAGISLPHGTRGDQLALDVLRGNAHDANHHAWDLERIRRANAAAS